MQTLNLTASEAAGRDPVNTGSITRIVWQAALPRGCSKTVLAWHAARNPHDQCWPHVDTLARLCGIQRRTALENLAALVKAGLIASTPRPGTSSLYQLNRAALVALSSEQPAAEIANRGAENANTRAKNADRGAENADAVLFSAPIREKEGREKEEGREREGRVRAPGAAAPAEAAFPPLPNLEIFKTEEQDAATSAARRIKPETLAALNAKFACHGRELPDLERLNRGAGLFGVTPQQLAEAMLEDTQRWTTPTDIVARSLQHLTDDLADLDRGMALADVVSHVISGLAGSIAEARGTEDFRGPPAKAVSEALLDSAETVREPAAASAPAPAACAAPAVAIAPDTLAAVNAQRVGNGKQPFSRADLIDLGRQATLAGISPQAAAEWILARPTRNFARAEWLTRPSAADGKGVPHEAAPAPAPRPAPRPAPATPRNWRPSAPPSRPGPSSRPPPWRRARPAST